MSDIQRCYEQACILSQICKTATPIKPSIYATDRTENGALTLHTTGNACLDLFFKTTQTIEEDQFTDLLNRAWLENPLTCLQIIAYIRSCNKKVPGQGARNPAIYA